MSKVKHLAEKGAQAGTGSNGLSINEGVEFPVVVHLFRALEGSQGDPRDVFGVTQHPIEVKYYEWFTTGLTSSFRWDASYLRWTL
jgi:hypothetical protein